MSPQDAEQRRLRRRFIADHHPDRGGDPDDFRTGLARFDEEPAAPSAPVRVIVVPTQPWPRSIATVVLARLTRHRRPPRVT